MKKQLFTIIITLLFVTVLSGQDHKILRPSGEIVYAQDVIFTKNLPGQDLTKSAGGDFNSPKDIPTDYITKNLELNASFQFQGQSRMLQWFEAPVDLIVLGGGFNISSVNNPTTVLSAKFVRMNWSREDLMNLEEANLGFYQAIGNSANDATAFLGDPDRTGEWIGTTNANTSPFGEDAWSLEGNGIQFTPDVKADYQWVYIPDSSFAVSKGEIIGLVVKNEAADFGADAVAFRSSNSSGIPGLKYYPNGRSDPNDDKGWWSRNYTWDLALAVEYTEDIAPDFASFDLLQTSLTTNARAVSAIVTDRNPGGGASGVNSVSVYYSIDDRNTFQKIPLSESSGTWSGFLPGQHAGTTVYYYYEAEDVNGNKSRAPFNDHSYIIFQSAESNLLVFNGFNGAEGYPQGYYFGQDDFEQNIPLDWPHDTWAYGPLTPELVHNYSNIIEITGEGVTALNLEVISPWLDGNENRNYLLAGQNVLDLLSTNQIQEFSSGDYAHDLFGITRAYLQVSSAGDQFTNDPIHVDAIQNSTLGGALYSKFTNLGLPELRYDPNFEIGTANGIDAFDILGGAEADMTVQTRGIFGKPDVRTLTIASNHRTLSNGNKVAFLSFDPISINTVSDMSLPEYYWFGHSRSAVQVEALEWFGIIGKETIDIAELKADDNQDFVPDKLNEIYTISGVVHTVNLLAGLNRLEYFIQDETGGISVYCPNTDSEQLPEFQRGDKIEVSGKLTQYKGKTEIETETLADIKLLSAGNQISPLTITIPELMSNPEFFEGVFILVHDLTKVDTSNEWPLANANSSMLFYNGPDQLSVFMDLDTDIDNNPQPSFPVNIQGVFSQFSNSVPANDGYQLIPSFYSDLTSSEGKINITFNVDMSYQITLQNFDPTTGNIRVTGNMNSKMNQGDDWNDGIEMIDFDNNQIYSFTGQIDDSYVGDTLRFKFRMNGDWEGFVGDDVNGNRIFAVEQDDMNLPVVYYNNEAPEFVGPSTPAPIPILAQNRVISLFSNRYSDVAMMYWDAEWDVADYEELQIEGDDVKKYSNLVYAGIEVQNPINLSQMTHFHIDLWTPDNVTPPASFKIKLVDYGANGVWNGQGQEDDVEYEISSNTETTPALTSGEWSSLDIPLSDFTGLITREHFAQLIISGDPNTVFVDNVYFYGEEQNFVNVTFNVDMTVQIQSGAFDINNGEVRVTGSINSAVNYSNNWNEGFLMYDQDSDGIYSITLEFNELALGTMFQYKYRMNGGWEENIVDNENGNRYFTLEQGGMNLPTYFYGDIAEQDLLSQPKNVLFTVDMNGALNSFDYSAIPLEEIEFVGLKGSHSRIGQWVGEWNPEDTLAGNTIVLHDDGLFGDSIANDNIWSRLVTFEIDDVAGLFEYKYGAWYPDAIKIKPELPMDNEVVFGVNHTFDLTDNGITESTNDNWFTKPENITPIQEVRQDLNKDYLPDNLGQTFTIQGLVSTTNFLASVNRIEYFVQDESSGISVYFPNPEGLQIPELQRGAELKVTGEVKIYNGKTELEVTDPNNVSLISTGNQVEPIAITIENLMNDPESMEGRFVIISGLSKSVSSNEWPAADQFANLIFTDQIEEINVFIDNDTDIDGSPEPNYPVAIKGVVSQYTIETIPNNNYQLLPSYYTDFVGEATGINTFIFEADLSQIEGSGVGFFDPATDSIVVMGLDWDGLGERIDHLPYSAMKRDINEPGLIYKDTIKVQGNLGNSTKWKYKAFPNGHFVNDGWELGEDRWINYQQDGAIVNTGRIVPDIVPVSEPLKDDKTLLFSVDLNYTPLNIFDLSEIPVDQVEFVVIKGSHERLGAWGGDFSISDTSNGTVLVLHDDGTFGDKVPNDNIWSRSVTFFTGDASGLIEYKYGAWYPGAEAISPDHPLDNEDVFGVNHQGIVNSDPYQEFEDEWATSSGETNADFLWRVDLVVKNQNNFNKVIFGLADMATDAIDSELGESPLPPSPPAGIFDVRLKLPNGIDASIKDFRVDTVKSALWQIQIQPGSQTNTVTIEWDNSKLPDGTLVIKDVFGGSIVNVNMASTNMLEIPDASILNKLYLEYKMSTCISVALNSGWNLFSIPISGDEMNVDNLFTNSTSPVYKFENGYSVVSEVEVATGYWIRNAMAEDIEVCGSAVGSNEVPILEGWNLIGGYVGDNSVSAITTEPAGILNSPFWGFEGGYNNSSLIVEGKGYWIRSTQNGIIQLNGALAKSDNLSYNNSTIDKNWGRIAISDASGKSIVLYASEMPNNEKSFDLPPLPPREIFDVRFSNQSLVAGLNEGSEIISIQSMNYPVTVSVEGVDVYIKDLLGGKLINSEIKNAGELVLSNSSIDKLEIGLVKIPVRFELSQNYPNPFNPVTKIAYSIPNISEETVDVTLKIYDVLGNEVVRLVDTKQSAGNYEVEWQALNFVSGIYFYKLSAGKFVEIKKMILLK